ncbi:MAG TPA: hypothetical protein VK099_05685 [Alcanivoracaceae bacterium]|nr:hypothetical protein [Alcanivoracaceae bacterium]
MSMLQQGPLLELLLSGQFVCAVTHETYYRQLQDEALREALNEYLRPLNRSVVLSADGAVFYLSWLQITPELREQLGAHLQEVYRSLLPLLEWMLLVQEISGRDGVLTAGDVLQQTDMIQRCEDNPSLRDRLAKLAADRFFNSSSDDVTLQVRQIFRRLVEHGYAIQPNAERQTYRITGKMDYLMELVRFLKDEENLPIDEEVAVQEAIEL